MITEAASQDFLISCISGASKPQIERHMEEYYDCGKEEIKELMEIHKFKNKPRFINYKKFYDLKYLRQQKNLNIHLLKCIYKKIYLSQEECDKAN